MAQLSSPAAYIVCTILVVGLRPKHSHQQCHANAEISSTSALNRVGEAGEGKGAFWRSNIHSTGRASEAGLGAATQYPYSSR